MTEEIFDIRGYEVRFICSKVVWIRKDSLTGEHILHSIRIDYLGAASRDPGSTVCPGDRYAVRAVKSPLQGRLNREAVSGVTADADRMLWANYWTQILLKDPEIRREGILLRYTVPPKLAAEKPLLQVCIEGKIVRELILEEAGTFEMRLDPEEGTVLLQSYLTTAHRIGGILLDEVIRICGVYGIPYYLVCGTLLGAVRHGDFVPWDDDVDVAFTRENYDRFVRAAEEEWKDSTSFQLLVPEKLKAQGFLDFMTRAVYMGETTENALFDSISSMGRPELRGKMALDLFILEQGSDISLLHVLQTQLIRGIYGLCLGHRTEDRLHLDRFGKQAAEQKVARVLSVIGRRLPLSFLLKWYRHVCGWFRNGKGRYLFQSNGYIMCIGWKWKKAWFGEGKTLSFGDRTVQVPADPDSCLKLQYMDYMSLPHAYYRIPSHMRRENKA